MTAEPGIYLPDEGFAVRLENNVLITDEGPVDLMANIPIEAEEIEELMNTAPKRSARANGDHISLKGRHVNGRAVSRLSSQRHAIRLVRLLTRWKTFWRFPTHDTSPHDSRLVARLRRRPGRESSRCLR
jgi:hypothetical protein